MGLLGGVVSGDNEDGDEDEDDEVLIGYGQRLSASDLNDNYQNSRDAHVPWGTW